MSGSEIRLDGYLNYHYQSLWGPLSGRVTSFAHIFLTITGLDSFILAMWSAQGGKLCVLLAPSLPVSDGLFCVFDFGLTASGRGHSPAAQPFIRSRAKGCPASSETKLLGGRRRVPPTWLGALQTHVSGSTPGALHLIRKSSSERCIQQKQTYPKCPLQKSQTSLYSNCWLLQWAACSYNHKELSNALLVLNSNLLSQTHSETPILVERGVGVSWVGHISVTSAVSRVSSEWCLII